MEDDGNIIDLNKILEEKERNKERAHNAYVKDLRAQLRWVLDELHRIGATYTEESENQEIEYKPAWHRRILNWFNNDNDI